MTSLVYLLQAQGGSGGYMQLILPGRYDPRILVIYDPSTG